MTEKSASEKTAKSKGDAGSHARANDSPAASAVKSETTGSGSHSSSKKRRKVNHGELLFARACDRDSLPSNSPPALLRRVTGWGGGRSERGRSTFANEILLFNSLCLLSSLGKPSLLDSNLYLLQRAHPVALRDNIPAVWSPSSHARRWQEFLFEDRFC